MAHEAILVVDDEPAIVQVIRERLEREAFDVREAGSGEAALAAVRQSGGTFVTVSDDKILESIRILAETEGVFAEPAGAAGVAGLAELLAGGLLNASETVALVVTGSGLKDVDAAFKVSGPAETVDPDPDALVSLLREEHP